MDSGWYMRPVHAAVEKFIAHAARKKNTRCLRFSESASLSLPPGSAEIPTLLYMHVPFCEELCPYCSFNRVEFREGLARPYFEALRKEVLMYRDRGYKFGAAYVGGGTPTILIDELASTLHLIRDNFEISEISVETNPNHLTGDNIRKLKEMGVNRLSVGVQTFDNNLLKALKRYHKYGSGEEIAAGLLATQGMFDTLNVDMISNLPGQTIGMIEQDLSTIIRLGVDQVTWYPLMASTSTKETMSMEFGMLHGGREREFYEKIVEMLSPHYKATTAWCFSRNASMIDEYPVKYEEYAGLGSGSIGHLGGSTYANTFDIASYIEKVNSGGLPLAAKRNFSRRDRILYDFLMKLFGLSLDVAALNARHGVNIYLYIWPEILFFRALKGLKIEGNIITLTARGQYYWFVMMREFFISVNNFRDYCRSRIGQ
jgi:menaquinone C8-methyltransferase